MVTRLLSLIPILIFTIFCILELVQFRLWPQVAFFWRVDYKPLEMLADFQGLRYLLVFPIFKLSDWMAIPHDRLFSLLIPVMIFAIAYYSTRSTQSLDGQESTARSALIFTGISCLFIILSMFMNGRMMFAMTGSSLLLWTLINWEYGRDSINLLSVVAAFFLASVSSGAFVTMIAAYYFFLAVNIAIANPSVCRRKILLIYSMLLLLLAPYLTLLIQKLLFAFGGGIGAFVKMLGHGYGEKLSQSNLAILTVGTVLVFTFGYRYRHLILHYWILASFMGFAIVGGLFGISTVTILLPHLSVAMCLGILRYLDKPESPKNEMHF